MKFCHRCSAPWPSVDQAGFNNTCEGCGTPVHCCANCSSYQPRSQRRCAEPQAPEILDAAAANRCELFRYEMRTAAGETTAATIEDVRRQLLNSENDEGAATGRSWDELFSD